MVQRSRKRKSWWLIFLKHVANCQSHISHRELIEEQMKNSTLAELFQSVRPVSEVKDLAQGYFIEDGVLFRKWVPHGEGFMGEPVYQVVIPEKFRNGVLRVAHDDSGHMGVTKTYARILRHFFWPRVKRSVSAYIKTCHICQVTGKPNQVITVSPLCPIPAVNEPFHHLIINCVGPLPPSKSGAAYLLTVMCQSTRYPASHPLRTISTKAVVGALTVYFDIWHSENYSERPGFKLFLSFICRSVETTTHYAQSVFSISRTEPRSVGTFPSDIKVFTLSLLCADGC